MRASASPPACMPTQPRTSLPHLPLPPPTPHARLPPQILCKVTGQELVGRTYEPLFPYFADLKQHGAFKCVRTAEAADGVGGVCGHPGRAARVDSNEHGEPGNCLVAAL